MNGDSVKLTGPVNSHMQKVTFMKVSGEMTRPVARAATTMSMAHSIVVSGGKTSNMAMAMRSGSMVLATLVNTKWVKKRGSASIVGVTVQTTQATGTKTKFPDSY